MSLLLDALKRAEQEKLARQGEGPAASPAPAAPESAAPRGTLELEAQPAPSAAPQAAPAADRGAAQAVFAAKREPEGPPSRSKTPLLIGAAVVVVLLIAGGTYVWMQLKSLSPSASATARAPAPRPVTPAPDASPKAAPGVAPGAAPGAALAAPPIATLKPGTLDPDARKSRPSAGAAEQLVLDLLKDAPGAAASPALKLSRSLDPPSVHPDVALGYDALKRGDLAAARRSYQAALAADPAGSDALLGLATVEARAGNNAAASRLYRRALELDPRSATALAGLASLADFARPEALEPQLRSDIARYPQSAALHFTLGNLYASQSRWSEAQAAFFEAHRLDPGNAEVLHNLAVSLDNLGQSKLAADYYRRALAAARGATQFDVRAVERRLAELKT